MDIDEPSDVPTHAGLRARANRLLQQEIYSKFRLMATNEIRAPEILPYKTQEVTILLSKIQEAHFSKISGN